MRNADAELFKDKIEVSLDGRQIFYLFFGGAVIASLVFVLGVMVGKRLESRSHIAENADTSAVLDPLAALDKLGSEERAERLEFPSALAGDSTSPSDQVEIAAVDDAPAANKAAPAPTPKPAAKTPAPPPAQQEPPAPKPTPAPAPTPAKPATATPAQEPPPPAAKPAAEIVAEAATPAKPAPKRARFTLQLSSFQDRTEAEAFHAELTSAGYEPYITEANVPDKGRWYRVRLGKYATHQDALDAKADFEKRQKIIAYVTRLK